MNTTFQDFQNFTKSLEHDLQQPLPGRSAQYNLAPQPRPGAEVEDSPSPTARKSSVLILFYPYADTVYFPLILRPTYPGVHSGQVGLPGGGFEEGDSNLIDTALREAQEEIGIDPTNVTILGLLSTLYVRPSNNLVLPVVGWSVERPTFLPDAREVALLIEASLLEFLDPANQRTEVWELQNRTAQRPPFWCAKPSYLGRNGDDPWRTLCVACAAQSSWTCPGLAMIYQEGVSSDKLRCWRSGGRAGLQTQIETPCFFAAFTAQFGTRATAWYDLEP